jgi:hypothetical protein
MGTYSQGFARNDATAQQGRPELPKCIKGTRITSIVKVSLIDGGIYSLLAAIFYTVPFTRYLGAAVDNQTDSQQFCCQSLCR